MSHPTRKANRTRGQGSGAIEACFAEDAKRVRRRRVLPWPWRTEDPVPHRTLWVRSNPDSPGYKI
jgi:hypothetical protein